MALYIGLIGEVPIAMCNSDYNFLKELKVEAIDTNQAIPWLTQAHEINLFFIEEYRQANPQKIFLLETAQSGRIENYYLTPIFSVFHPPSILA